VQRRRNLACKQAAELGFNAAITVAAIAVMEEYFVL
jgi:hypothetical protein